MDYDKGKCMWTNGSRLLRLNAQNAKKQQEEQRRIQQQEEMKRRQEIFAQRRIMKRSGGTGNTTNRMTIQEEEGDDDESIVQQQSNVQSGDASDAEDVSEGNIRNEPAKPVLRKQSISRDDSVNHMRKKSISRQKVAVVSKAIEEDSDEMNKSDE